VKVCGVQGVSIIDYPGRIASVLFLGGCNFRCPFCQNPDLVLRPESLPGLDLEETMRSIEKKKGFVDGVVVTGGEPLIHGEALLSLLQRLHEAGLAVKLDTNGYEVELLREILASGLVDYVAMDVKTSLARYPKAAGKAVDTRRIEEAIRLIMDSGLEYEFRTTCVPGIVEEQDIREIAALVSGAKRYYLQQFRPNGPMIDAEYEAVRPHGAAILGRFLSLVSPSVQTCGLRGA
jgi:pyruvate formate lyase activating enzyme